MKQFEVTTANGVKLVVNVNPSGFVKVSDGQRTKSQALVSFARVYLGNPSIVDATPLEHGVVVTLADGSVWFIDANSLIIFRVEEGSEVLTSQPTQDEQKTSVSQQQEQQEQSEHGNGKPTNGTAANKPKRGVTKIAETLSAILKTQGLSDEQIAEILAALDQTASSRRSAPQFDTSTPEGKLMAGLAKVHRSLSRSIRFGNFNITVTTLHWKGKSGITVRYENGVLTVIDKDGQAYQYPSN